MAQEDRETEPDRPAREPDRARARQRDRQTEPDRQSRFPDRTDGPGGLGRPAQLGCL